MTVADREIPVGAHLQVVVQAFHPMMVKMVALPFGFRRPNQRFMGIGKTDTPKIWHRVVLDPNDVVQDPKAQILQDRPDPEDVVIGTNDPDGAISFNTRLQAPNQALVKRSYCSKLSN